MTFQNQLNDYILQARCSSKELATASGLSEGTISRYRNGYRVPGVASEQVTALAAGLYSILSAVDAQISEEHILATLRDSIGNGLVISYDVYIQNLKRLLRSFEISNNELGRKLNYDPSYISRILSGQRRPGDIPPSLAEFLGCDEQTISTPDGLQTQIEAWLCAD